MSLIQQETGRTYAVPLGRSQRTRAKTALHGALMASILFVTIRVTTGSKMIGAGGGNRTRDT